MGKCEYLDCKNLTRRIKRDKGSNLSFFRFPIENDLCKKWIEACQRESLFEVGVENLHKSHVICGVHFKDFDFLNPLTKKKLRNGAVPCHHSVLSVPKADFISSYGHYIVRNRHEPRGKYTSSSKTNPELKENSNNTNKANMNFKESKDLTCLEHLTNVAQNLSNILPPLSPGISILATDSADLDQANIFSKKTEMISTVGHSIMGVDSKNIMSNSEKSSTRTGCSSNKSFVATEKFCLMNGQNIIHTIDSNQSIEEAITYLTAEDNSIENLSFMKSYKYLANISLSNNKVNSLHWFVGISSLKKLNLSGNSLSNVENLNKLGSLSHIDLSNNAIKGLEEFVPLSGIDYSNLLFLNLSGNKINQIVDISVFINLKEIILDSNYIKSLSYWGRYLPNSIAVLFIQDNYISDLLDFNELSSFKNLANISVKGNPCFCVVIQQIDSDNKPTGSSQLIDFIPFIMVKCPNLNIIDGKYITSKERKKAMCLIHEIKIHHLDLNNKKNLIACLAKYCLKNDTEPTKNNLECTSRVRSINAASDMGYEPNNYECSSASCFRNKTAIEEKARHNYIELIEERARNHKLKRENESLLEKIHFLESIVDQNRLNISGLIDFEVKIETEDDELS